MWIAGLSMYSIATGTMPAPMIAATHWLASSTESKPNRTGRAPSGSGMRRTIASVTMPKLALGAADKPEEVIAGRVHRLAADIEDFAVQGDEARAEEIVGCDAVFEAMGAARVHRDVAADRAGELGGRIGRVKEALRPDRFRNREIGHARFDAREAVGEVDLEDAAHLGQGDDDRVFLRDRAARERGPGAARHDIDLLVAAEPHDARDLLGRARQRHRERQAAVGSERVGLERPPAGFVGNEAFGRQDRRQALDDRPAARKDRLVEAGKGDVGHGVLNIGWFWPWSSASIELNGRRPSQTQPVIAAKGGNPGPRRSRKPGYPLSRV